MKREIRARYTRARNEPVYSRTICSLRLLIPTNLRPRPAAYRAADPLEARITS